MSLSILLGQSIYVFEHQLFILTSKKSNINYNFYKEKHTSVGSHAKERTTNSEGVRFQMGFFKDSIDPNHSCTIIKTIKPTTRLYILAFLRNYHQKTNQQHQTCKLTLKHYHKSTINKPSNKNYFGKNQYLSKMYDILSKFRAP